MNNEKDYSLLRPFDLEAAKRGEPVCHKTDASELWDYVAGPDSNGKLCLAEKSNGAFINPANAPVETFRMAPLAWVEGKPVYKGDVLWLKSAGRRIAVGVDSECLRLVTQDGEPWGLFRADHLTWASPKVKRDGWVNVYPCDMSGQVACTSNAWATKSAADVAAQDGRIDCVRIEWEEPAGGAQ